MQILEPGLRGTGKVMMCLAERVPPHPGQEAEAVSASTPLASFSG